MDSVLKLDDIINSTQVGIIAADTRCRIILINKYAEKSLAVGVRDVIGTHISSLLPLAEDAFRRCMRSEDPQLGQRMLANIPIILGNITPILNDNQISGAVCAFFEQNELAGPMNKVESFMCLEQELDAVFNSAADGSWLCDGEGNVLKCNKSAEEQMGINSKDIVGKKALYLLENGYVDISVTGQVVRNKEKVKVIQHLKKTQKYVVATGTPVFDKDGNIFRVVVNTKDITGLNAIRKQLKESQKVTEKYKDKLSELSMMELNKKQDIIAESENIKQVLRIALKLAHMGASSILIQGETGVGKGLLAKLIHKSSRRQKNSFIHINCAALPENLLEAELFGYEKGAFTGASEQGKAGLIELATNGTLFLDEIGDIPLSIQAKLLTYLDDHLVRPLGSVKSKKIGCSIIAATNRNLEGLVKQKKFRDDLFYRLNTFSIKIPPLRERKEDIFKLSLCFLRKFNEEYRLSRRFSSNLMNRLCSYSFPGNVRELESLIEQAAVMSEDDVIDDAILTCLETKCSNQSNSAHRSDNTCSLIEKTRIFEKDLIKSALTHAKSTREMARCLGISQSAVVKKLKKYSLPTPNSIPNRIN